MEIGIDSFASAMYGGKELGSIDAMEQLLDRIVAADKAGLDIFGIGEHHKKRNFWILLLLSFLLQR